MKGQYVVWDGNSRLLIARKTKAEKIKVIIETFEKLEPEAHAENLSRKEDYGKSCEFCAVYTRDFDVDKCPFCGRKLALLYLKNY